MLEIREVAKKMLSNLWKALSKEKAREVFFSALAEFTDGNYVVHNRKIKYSIVLYAIEMVSYKFLDWNVLVRS